MQSESIKRFLKRYCCPWASSLPVFPDPETHDPTVFTIQYHARHFYLGRKSMSPIGTGLFCNRENATFLSLDGSAEFTVREWRASCALRCSKKASSLGAYHLLCVFDGGNQAHGVPVEAEWLHGLLMHDHDSLAMDHSSLLFAGITRLQSVIAFYHITQWCRDWTAILDMFEQSLQLKVHVLSN
jgi:hypothetical protein